MANLPRRTLLSIKRVVSRCTLHTRFNSTESSSKGLTPFLLLCPATAFGLGCWQVQRLEWKVGLIRELEEKVNMDGIPLPDDILKPGRIEELNFQPVLVEGTFDHTKEIHLGPRSRMNTGSESGGGIFQSGTSNSGYQIVTPLILESGERILVNRGWVHHKRKKAETRGKGQIDGTVKIRGIIRAQENRPKWTPNVIDEYGVDWHYRDVKQFSIILNTLPVCIDADRNATVKGGPVGGQTPVYLRNEHKQYAITWFSLAACTLVMWAVLRKNPSALGPNKRPF